MARFRRSCLPNPMPAHIPSSFPGLAIGLSVGDGHVDGGSDAPPLKGGYCTATDAPWQPGTERLAHPHLPERRREGCAHPAGRPLPLPLNPPHSHSVRHTPPRPPALGQPPPTDPFNNHSPHSSLTPNPPHSPPFHPLHPFHSLPPLAPVAPVAPPCPPCIPCIPSTPCPHSTP